MPAGKGIRIAAVTLIALVPGGAALALASDSSRSGPVRAGALKEPQVIRSKDGVLRARLVAAEGPATVAGKRVNNATTYNGRYPGPTLRVAPGDTIRLTVVNKLTVGTNIHFHGFHVSPSGISDNVLRHFGPGTTKKVVVHIPRDHANGTYWYHPHLHGQVNNEVYGGMAGVIVVEGGRNRVRSLERFPERVLAIQNSQLTDDGKSLVPPPEVKEPTALATVNGQLDPTIQMRRGRTELWRLANISNQGWYRLELNGHRFNVVGEDGNPYSRTVSKEELLLAPGKRFDVLVTAGQAGTFKLRRLTYDNGLAKFPDADLAEVNVAGKRTRSPSIPGKLMPFENLSNARVAVHRRLQFTIEGAFPTLSFLINGKEFDADDVNVHARVNKIEEWKLENPSTQDHPFHIHTNDFQVVKINGKRVTVRGGQDVARIPRGGSITIRLKPITFTGKAVYHCHVLFHEDHGMMGIVEWTRAKTARYTIARATRSGGGFHDSHAGAGSEAAASTGSFAERLNEGGSTTFASFTSPDPQQSFLCHLQAVAAVAPERRKS